MSQYPNNQQQGYYGRPAPPNRVSSSGPMGGGVPMPTAYNDSATGSQDWNTAHMRQLAEFHQQQRQQAIGAGQQHQSSQPQAPQLVAPPRVQQVMQQQQQQQQRVQTPQQQHILQQYMQTGQQPVSAYQAQLHQVQQLQQNQQRPNSAQSQRMVQSQQQQQYPLLNHQQQQQQHQHMRVPPAQLPPAQPRPQQMQQPLPIQHQQPTFNLTLPPQRNVPPRPPSPTLPSNTLRRPSIPSAASVPITQAFTPLAQGIPPQVKVEQAVAGSSTPKRPQEALASGDKDRRPRPRKERKSGGLLPAVYFAAIEPTTRETAPSEIREARDRERERESRTSPAFAEVRRRRDEGMRGSMRNEISRLMYAAGDVPDPDLDSVDYMEDLAVEFIADLCQPIPPIRSNPSSAHQTVPLTAGIIRHRLSSRPSLRKYLDRFDVMTFMSSEIAAQKRVANSTETHFDLIDTVGKDYLGIDEAGADVDGVKKRRGRPPNPDKVRLKPGPPKGFKRVVDPNAPRVKRPYKRKEKGSSVVAKAEP